LAKKKILFPIVYETKYYEGEWRKGEPYAIKGSLLSYVLYVPSEPCIDEQKNIEWVENRVFEDTLTYTGYARGRSSAVLCFEGRNGEKYDMFMTDVDDLLKTKDIIDRKVTAKWTYCKRGQNYGIRLVDSEIASNVIK